MRLAILALTFGALGAQSPFYDELARREAERRAFYEKEARAAAGGGQVAIAVRPGRPLAWVSVVADLDAAKHCDIPSEAIVFQASDRLLYKCGPKGARVPFAVDYSVILAPAPVVVIEWRGGRMEEHHLR